MGKKLGMLHILSLKLIIKKIYRLLKELLFFLNLKIMFVYYKYKLFLKKNIMRLKKIQDQEC